MRAHRGVAVALLAAAAGVAASPLNAADPLTVYAVNGPLASFATRVGGDAVEVVMPAPEGSDPANWRPSIAEVAEVQAADLILLNGAGYAQWAAKVSLPRSRTVDTSRAFADRLVAVEGITHSHGSEGEHSHTATATITWLDFAQAAEQARAVADALSKAAPDAAAAIASGQADLEADLADLDAEARRIGSAAAGTRILASHPRYQYFARAYGVDVASVEWDASETPSDEQWLELDALRAGAPEAVMLWEATPTADTAQRLEADGITIVAFPTLAGEPDADFVAGMRASLDRLEAALAP